MSQPPAADDGRIVVLCSVPHAAEAAAIRAALDDAGIVSRLNGDLLGGAMGNLQLGFRGEYEVWVHERDRDAAGRVMAQLQDERDADGEDEGPEGDFDGADADAGE